MACSSLCEIEVLGLSRIVFVAMALAMTAASARIWRSPSSSNSLCRKDYSELSVRLCSPGLRSWNGAAVVCAAGKRNPGPKPRSGTQARRKPKVQRIVDNDDEDVEKALEALFAQLEMDLIEEGDDGGDDGEEFTDEELNQMTKELEAAYLDMDHDEDDEDEDADSSGLVDMVMTTDGVYSQGKAQAQAREQEDELDDEDLEDDDDDEQRMVPLDKWKLLKLAAAVEKGRRNVNVKSLAAELGMDRADVLTFLKDPPPDLLLMSAQLAAEEDEEEEEEDSEEIVVPKVSRTAASRKQSAPPATTPSGAPQSPRNWHGSKRLKKEHLATFERVYRQTNRPSNTMIENLVNLTHVPRKKVLQWFDERRAEDKPRKESFKNAPES